MSNRQESLLYMIWQESSEAKGYVNAAQISH